MINILFLDDVKLVTQLISEMLAPRTDCIVTTFTSPNKALSHMSEHQFDVIISDYHMPELDGVSFLRKCTQLQPDAIRIMMTMSEAKEVIEDSMNEIEAHYYLQKPIDSSRLNSVIDKCITRIEESGNN